MIRFVFILPAKILLFPQTAKQKRVNREKSRVNRQRSVKTCRFFRRIAANVRKVLYLCSRYNTLMRIIMSNEEKKERMARNYAINSKKTPRTRRMAFARAHAGGIIITDPKLKERLTTYAD